MFKIPPPDGSRDPRIEDPTNAWLVHPLSRLLLPIALKFGISANTVSVVGLALGAAAAWAYLYWQDWRFVVLGLVLCFLWLVADGLDGMIARATNTSSALGRMLDGLCDHGVFAFLYFGFAFSVGTGVGWMLAVVATAFHAIQSSIFEGERARFHRRLKGDAGSKPPTLPNFLMRTYDRVAGSLDRMAQPFDDMLSKSADPKQTGEVYGKLAVPALRFMTLNSANTRVLAMFGAAMLGELTLFWWFEIIPLTIVALYCVIWHRRIETRLVEGLRVSTSHDRDTGTIHNS